MFGSVVGTVHLLTPDERALFRGFAINKFRGDLSLFDDGVRMLRGADGVAPVSACFRTPPTCTSTPRTAWRWTHGAARPAPAGARIAIVRLPHLSNATDFRLLDVGRLGARRRLPAITTSSSCRARRTRSPIWRGCAQSGLADWMWSQHRRGAHGDRHLRRLPDAGARDVAIPTRVESTAARLTGLGLLPVDDVLDGEKRTRAVTRDDAGGVAFGGYEIHLGVTTLDRRRAVAPFATARARRPSTAPACRASSAPTCTARSSIRRCARRCSASTRRRGRRRREYERLADWFERTRATWSQLGLRTGLKPKYEQAHDQSSEPRERSSPANCVRLLKADTMHWERC